jgi:hypothetical protein
VDLLTFQGRQVLRGGLGLQFTTSDNKAKTMIFIAKFMSKFEETFSSSPYTGIIAI